MVSRSLIEYDLARLQDKLTSLPAGSSARGRPVNMMTSHLPHGGIAALLDPTFMQARMSNVGFSLPPGKTAKDMAGELSSSLSNFFSSLVVGSAYTISAPLISYLTLPGKGRMVSTTNEPSLEILAVFTFIGQFIDHDLTLNALNLFPGTAPIPPQGPSGPQDPGHIINEASPLIDLDHVYGPRVDDMHPPQQRQTSMRSDGYFGMRKIGIGFDACRGPDGKALIGDKRNEDNQIILQIHVLIMRLHNAFLRQLAGSGQTTPTMEGEARRLTTLNWQSMVASEYLPLIARPDEIAMVLNHLGPGHDAKLKYKPTGTGTGTGASARLRLPHEFAIGFRFGHSQLRSRYRLQPCGSIPLFDKVANDGSDLQGGRPLMATHIIDWPFFLGKEADHSNLIDTRVTEVVFDLPASTIPDDLTLVGDLPFRNLVRSNQLELCSGEDLVKFYNASPSLGTISALSPSQVDAGRPDLFMLDKDGKPSGVFRTPLWFYLLREAEIDRDQTPGTPARLGHLGSRLVAEVILSGIYYATTSFIRDTAWQSTIAAGPDKRKVTLWDIAKFATASPTEPGCE